MKWSIIHKENVVIFMYSYSSLVIHFWGKTFDDDNAAAAAAASADVEHEGKDEEEVEEEKH